MPRSDDGRSQLANPAMPLRRLLPIALAFCATALFPPAQAQDRQIIGPGATAVSGFSGLASAAKDAGAPAGQSQAELIDSNGASLRIFDLSALGDPALGVAVATPKPFEVLAGQVGQVFGLTFDDGIREGAAPGAPDLYAAATSLYGLRVVTYDSTGEPQVVRRGAPGTRFMAGQFGAENGGGPGTIWRIDGISGAVSKFADIGTNTGPGIGDIAFDKPHRQFFASDLDTGLIHRIDASGTLVDSFDHGVSARRGAGLAELKDDGTEMDISAAAFDSQDPTSWGYTQDERRVWGLAVDSGRLYYAVGDKAELWSVGIGDDGTFAGDARREFAVGGGNDFAVTDIVFGDSNDVYLAERSGTGPGKPSADAAKARLLRYVREKSGGPSGADAWVLDPQPVGGELGSGGAVDLQYGYDSNGRIAPAACSATVVAAGALQQAASLPPVAGIRLTPVAGTATASWHVGLEQGDAAFSQAGDVEVWHPCGQQTAAGKTAEKTASEAASTVQPAEGMTAGQAKPRPVLQVEQTGDARCQPGKPCTFEIKITNPGAEPFVGPIRFGDAIGVDGIGRLEGVSIASIEPPLDCHSAGAKLPWSCTGGGGLGGGGSSTHKMTVVIAAAALGGAVSPVAAQNCFAAVPLDTTVAGLAGGAAAPGGPGGGGPFACHRFTIDIPKGAGECTLLPGQIRTKQGRCVCRKGTSLANGKCVAARQPACKVSGQVRGKSGVCACPRGTQAVNGVCRKPPRGCPAGTTAVRGNCVPDDQQGGGCIAGEIYVNGQCMIVEGCPRGTVGEFPNCRPARRPLHQPSNDSDRPDSPGRQGGGGRDPNGGGSTPGGPNGP